MSAKPCIAVTMGDPAGIGPELCLRLLSDSSLGRVATPVVVGSVALLARVARRTGFPALGVSIGLDAWRQRPVARSPLVIDVGDCGADRIRPGRVQKAAGMAARVCVDAAIAEATAGRVAAIVTAPIHKEAWSLAGVRFAGHTEYLAAMTGARRYCMTMASDRIVVSLVTTHAAIRAVPDVVQSAAVFDTIALTREALRRLLGREPRIAVLALNPHGGEGGLFGDEDRRCIVPGIRRAVRRGYRVEGPLPSDTAFLPARLRATDAYVAMYHDQGLIPFKMLAFETGVNVTLGLPIVRVSPDHGTAFDIAWKGKASPTSMFAAVRWAARLSHR